MNKIGNYLELVRLPGVFTAHADILAGFLIAGAGWSKLPVLIVLLLSASCFFFAGMALNDFFDRRIDALERPDRPIPSGRIPPESAFLTGLGFLGGGLLFASIAGTPSLMIGVLLAAAIVAYDGGVKKIPWAGPATMGACRYLNLLLGFSILPVSGAALAIPLLTGMYIFGVTVLSGSETKGDDPRAVIVSALSMASVFAVYNLLYAFGVLPDAFGRYAALAAVLMAVAGLFRLLVRSSPKDFQQTMKWLLISLVILDGIIVAGVRPVYEALLVWMLIVPVILVSRKMYMT